MMLLAVSAGYSAASGSAADRQRSLSAFNSSATLNASSSACEPFSRGSQCV